jgi:ubiquinone/menaquinone biosynthesis C-methylase UbiE
MGIRRKPIYKGQEAKCLQEREAWAQRERQMKFPLLLQKVGSCQRLVDIGCGWGQFLAMARTCAAELWGVDESPDRAEDTIKFCPEAKVVICRADKLKLPDSYFDVAVTSQMLHEVKLFGEEAEVAGTLSEIRRILTDGGKYLLLDHRDAGEGEVVVRLPEETMRQLEEFEAKFKYYPATHERTGDDLVRISKRCLQDYLSKTWSFNSPMESMEMNETHNVFEKDQTIQLIESSGFEVRSWETFSDIREDLRVAGGELVEGEPWERKFLLVALKL